MVWPFRRKDKKRQRRPQQGTSAMARQRAEAMRAARAEGNRPTTDERREATLRLRRARKKYVPPPVPDDPTTLPIEYQAPKDHTIWWWVKTAPIDYFIEGWFERDPYGFEDYSQWPRADLPRGIRAIRRHVLDLIMEASKASYPNEFGGMLRVEDGIIDELILAPGTEGGATAAIFQLHMMPVDMSIVGTIHSHPSPIPYPSAADTNLFERYGRIHIITGHPFGPTDWRAFDHRSHLVPLKVVD
jgi:proteasome lid subunit RPN8/RPN11